MPLYCPAPFQQGWPICSETVAYFTPKGRPVCSESPAFLLRETQFAAFLVFLSPTISELLTVNNWSELNELFQANQLLPWLVMLPFIVLGIMLCFARKIDAWESRETDKKADKRHQELLSAIRDNPFNNSVQELINEIRQDRNERNNRDSK